MNGVGEKKSRYGGFIVGKSVKGIIRMVGIWDLLLTLPFALPVVNGYAIGALRSLNGLLSPAAPFPEFSGFHLFFVQLFGILAVLWAAVRVHTGEAYLGAYDSAGRLVVGSCMIAFTLQGGGLVPAAFSASEFGFALVQAYALSRGVKG